MMRSAAPALVLAAASLVFGVSRAAAETAYVSDDLVLNVYTEQNQQGQRLATLHSGARVETLATSADFTQVRLADGTTGWVKSSYLTTDEPAAVRLKQLQEELDRTRATTPALAEAAAKSEMERRERELAEKQAQLADKQAQLDAALAARAPAAAGAAPPLRGHRPGAGLWLGVAAAAGALGFWGGYATLARRVRRKFGGLKVY
jgi:SH3 domain protein